MPQIEIHYRRPPARLDVFTQELVVDRPDLKVTLHERPPVATPLQVGERVIFEPGAAIVWFVFPDRWYDLGRFHLRDDTFTGYYVNLIAPPQIHGRVWHMYDLFLDVWVEPDAAAFQVLDRDEFDEAVDRGWLDTATAQRARQELQALANRIRQGRWPPKAVREIDLAYVRRRLAQRP